MIDKIDSPLKDVEGTKKKKKISFIKKLRYKFQNSNKYWIKFLKREEYYRNNN